MTEWYRWDRVPACASFVLLLIGLLGACSTTDERAVADVIEAIEQPVLQRLQPDLLRTGLTPPFERMTLLAFKQERTLQVWARDQQGRWALFKSYPFTAFSGRLGPKLREGDRQIPEGIYDITYLNPFSNYHLSLKVDYPNAFDRAMARLDGRSDLGGDIYIHGKALTIGCIPIGDRAIEELFYLVQRSGRDHVTLIIAPYDLRRDIPPPRLAHIDWEPVLYQEITDRLQVYH